MTPGRDAADLDRVVAIAHDPHLPSYPKRPPFPPAVAYPELSSVTGVLAPGENLRTRRRDRDRRAGENRGGSAG